MAEEDQKSVNINNLLQEKSGKKIYSPEDFNTVIKDTADILNKQLLSYGVEIKGDLAGVSIGSSSGNSINGVDGGGGPQWKSATFANVIGAAQAKKFKDNIEVSKSAINQTQVLLKSVKSLVGLLSDLESVISDPLAGVAKQVITYFKNILTNLKTTGIYALDLSEPYFVGSESLIIKIPKIAEGESIGIEEPSYTKNAKTTRVDSNTEKLRWYYRYKPTTYNDFIQMTADAFIDVNDIPEGSVSGGKYRNRKLANGESSNKEAAGLTNSEKQSLYDFFKNEGNLKKFRPGRPQFEKGSVSIVYVLAVQATDIAEFIRIWDDFITLMGLSEEGPDRIKRTSGQRFIEGLNTTLSGVYSDTAEASAKWYDGWLQGIGKTAGNSLPMSGGAIPDFYGASLYSIWPKIFDNLDDILIKIESQFKDLSNGISDLFEDVISEVSFQIDRLNDITIIIDRYIKLIETLEGLSINALKITSTKGNFDIYEQLLTAQGFPLQDSATPQWIAGVVLCAGTIDPTAIGSLDMKDAMNQYAIAKNEATGAFDLAVNDVDNSKEQLSKIMKSFNL